MDYSTISAQELALVCFQTTDQLAWAEFIRRFHPLIARVAIRVAQHWGETSPQVIDDLIQETYLKLCSERVNLSERFTPAHKDAVFGYIKVITANLVHDHFKANRSQKRDSALTSSIETPTGSLDIEGTLPPSERTMERAILLKEIDSCLKTVAPGPNGRRDRLLFWLYFRVGLPASEIGRLPGIALTTKGVESTLLRLSRQIRQRLSAGGPRMSRAQDAEKGNRSAESL